MANLEKIKWMTQLAIHDKKYIKDKKITDYYRSDYIYKKNSVNRISALIALGIIFSMVVLDMVYFKEIDVFSLDYKAFGTKWVIILVGVLGFYTMIGTIKYGKEYDEAQKRTKKYFSILSKLDKQGSGIHDNLEGLDGGSDGRDFPN